MLCVGKLCSPTENGKYAIHDCEQSQNVCNIQELLLNTENNAYDENANSDDEEPKNDE